jgi:hypothetical protein
MLNRARSIVGETSWWGIAAMVAIFATATTTTACSSSKAAGKDAGGEEDATTTDDTAAPTDDAASDGGTTGSGTFTNVGAVDFTGTGDVIITTMGARIQTDVSDIFGASSPDSAFKFMQVEQPGGAPTMAVYVARSFRIEASATVAVRGPNPLVLIAQNKIEVFGTISASGDRRTAVAGGSAATTAGKGGGPGGGGPSNSYSAGGGGSFCGIGGAGNTV